MRFPHPTVGLHLALCSSADAVGDGEGFVLGVIMLRLAEKLFLVLSLVLVSACGSTSQSTNIPAANAAPTPAQPSNSCPTHQLAVGDTVAYMGPRSATTNFSDANAAYLGVVKQINRDVLVTFDHGIGDVAVSSVVIVPQIVCSPDYSGRSVQYIGAQTAGSAFVPGHTYFGKIVATYSLNYLEIVWNDLSYHTIEPGANVSIGQ